MNAPIRIELPNKRQIAPVNVYLFLDPEPILVDTSAPSEEDWAALQAGLAKHGLTVADLSRVIITHGHVDHFGQAAAIAANSKADIWVSELSYDWVVNTAVMWQKRIAYYRDQFFPYTGAAEAMVEMALGYMQMTAATCQPTPANRVTTFPANGNLQIGGLSWQVLPTPGHASHQTSFYQPETRQFLAADMLLQQTPTPVVERPLSGSKRLPSLPHFLESLDLVEALAIDIVYPGHGEPFREHRALIQRQRVRILRRKQECLDYIKEGIDTAVSLTGKLYANRPPVIQFAGLWMVIGYLDLLVADGLIETQQINGIQHYSINK